MTQPMFFHRRPEVVQAIQWIGDNKQALFDFMGQEGYNHHKPSMTEGMWVYKDRYGRLHVVSHTYFEHHFMQKNETL